MVLGALAAAVALFVLFIAVERRSSSPLVRPSIFQLPGLGAGNLLMLGLGAAAGRCGLPELHDLAAGGWLQPPGRRAGYAAHGPGAGCSASGVHESDGRGRCLAPAAVGGIACRSRPG